MVASKFIVVWDVTLYSLVFQIILNMEAAAWLETLVDQTTRCHMSQGSLHIKRGACVSKRTKYPGIASSQL
jgi:hypothetical protein